MENREREFTEEEFAKFFGGYPHMSGNEHPFEEAELYGESQKEKLQELKQQLEELDREKHSGRGR